VHYTHATGPALTSCALLAHHGDRSWVVAVRAGTTEPLQLGVRLEVPTGLAALWRTDAGGLFAADPAGKVWMADDPFGPAAGHWRSQELGLVLRGVHGRGDDVVVWGLRPSDGAAVLARFDGTTWSPIPGPGFRLASVRVGADGVWAVGDDGLACWDGEGWSILEGVGALTALDVGDEVLVAAADGTVSAGGRAGFRVLGQGPERPWAVAAWRGGVWVGGASGLYQLGAGRVREREVSALDGRGELLVTTPDLLMATTDGAKFAGGLRGTLAHLAG
jgi:hypothetical protein